MQPHWVGSPDEQMEPLMDLFQRSSLQGVYFALHRAKKENIKASGALLPKNVGLVFAPKFWLGAGVLGARPHL